MLRNWQAEKQNLVKYNHALKVSVLRKKLKNIWKQAGKTDDEVASIDQMKKRDLSKNLYLYYHIMAVEEQERNRR